MIVKALGLMPLGKVIKSYTVSVTGSDTGSTSGVGSAVTIPIPNKPFTILLKKFLRFMRYSLRFIFV